MKRRSGDDPSYCPCGSVAGETGVKIRKIYCKIYCVVKDLVHYFPVGYRSPNNPPNCLVETDRSLLQLIRPVTLKRGSLNFHFIFCLNSLIVSPTSIFLTSLPVNVSGNYGISISYFTCTSFFKESLLSSVFNSVQLVFYGLMFGRGTPELHPEKD